jgi:hypothetical protein
MKRPAQNGVASRKGNNHLPLSLTNNSIQNIEKRVGRGRYGQQCVSERREERLWGWLRTAERRAARL